MLGDIVGPILFDMNSDDDTECSHRGTRTRLIVFDDEALCANDQTDTTGNG